MLSGVVGILPWSRTIFFIGPRQNLSDLEYTSSEAELGPLRTALEPSCRKKVEFTKLKIDMRVKEKVIHTMVNRSNVPEKCE